MNTTKQEQGDVYSLVRALINQRTARVIVQPKIRADGFWFGGGNMVLGPDGALHVVGRYRNAGDSRSGLAKGDRGLELALFRSEDAGETFSRYCSFSKNDLSAESGRVLSIEGSCLVNRGNGYSLFVSSEKERRYPDEVAAFQKDGTGIWSIDEMRADDPASFDPSTITEVVRSDDPAWLHVKDPFWVPGNDGTDRLFFCTHPYNWSSSNTGYAAVDRGTIQSPVFSCLERGSTWDVAITRATAVMPLPRVESLPQASVLFYDGGECMRKLDEHSASSSRPRGYSCEEIGGAMLVQEGEMASAQRLSRLQPLFVSPWGTGASRYVDVLVTKNGYYATWQQSQDDMSQPLVMNYLSHDDVSRALAGETDG